MYEKIYLLDIYGAINYGIELYNASGTNLKTCFVVKRYSPGLLNLVNIGVYYE
tara:strand:+ start:1229 stop:1387 length:159 start_codon:yes stop_codon:yes gene_type:complete